MHGSRHKYGPDQWQFGDLRMPKENRSVPILVLIHGGFWRPQYGLDLMEPMASEFVRNGYATFNIEYRRSGQHGGGWPGTLDDMTSAVNYLTVLASTYPLDLNRVTLIGHSAGGQMALWMAGRHLLPKNQALNGARTMPLQRVVSLAGVVDLLAMWQIAHGQDPVEKFLGGPPTMWPDRYREASPINLLPTDTLTVLVHGTEDSRVPLAQSQNYWLKARTQNSPVTLKTLPGVDHFQLIDPHSAAWPTVMAAVTKRYPD